MWWPFTAAWHSRRNYIWGKAGMPYSAFFLLVWVWTPMWNEYVAVVSCMCLWLTWFDGWRILIVGLCSDGLFNHGFIWFGSLDWPLAWTRSSQHKKRPNQSKGSSWTKRAVQRRQTLFDPDLSMSWLTQSCEVRRLIVQIQCKKKAKT